MTTVAVGSTAGMADNRAAEADLSTLLLSGGSDGTGECGGGLALILDQGCHHHAIACKASFRDFHGPPFALCMQDVRKLKRDRQGLAGDVFGEYLDDSAIPLLGYHHVARSRRILTKGAKRGGRSHEQDEQGIKSGGLHTFA